MSTSNDSKGLIVFIAGYTLESESFLNYARICPEWNHLYFNYYGIKSLEAASNTLIAQTKLYADKAIVIVSQSLGFKIAIHSISKGLNVNLLLAFNPFFHFPGSTLVKNCLRAFNSLFLQPKLGELIIKYMTSPKSLLIARQLAGNKPYNSIRLYKGIIKISRVTKEDPTALTSPIHIIFDKSIIKLTSKVKTIFVLGEDDKILDNTRNKNYYEPIINKFKPDHVYYLTGGHEGFLTNERHWISTFEQIMSRYESKD